MHQSRTLEIGEVAARTHVSATALRMWEERYGFPSPPRDGGGHRRYTEQDVARLQQVLRYRAAGLALKAAIARVRDENQPPERSLFALHREWRLTPRPMSARAVRVLVRAVEDEFAMGAEGAVVAASYGSEAELRSSAPRWRQLTASADQGLSFGPPLTSGTRTLTPHTVLGVHEPLAHEVFRVCDSAGMTVTFVARPLPVAKPSDPARHEVVWTADPVAARVAAMLCLRRAVRAYPALQASLEALEARPPADAEASTVGALAQRMVSYLADALEEIGR